MADSYLFIVSEDVAPSHTALHDVHRQALNKRSMLPIHNPKGEVNGALNRV